MTDLRAPASPASPVLRAERLYRFLGPSRQPVLQGVSVDVAEGEFVALTGQSGSGKSTLLYLLGALDRPDRGLVRYRGQDLGALSDDARADFRGARLGFVFQFHFLLAEFTVRENVMLPMLRRGTARDVAGRAADEALGYLGLGALAARRPGQLSGGQQQRVAVARALAHKPDVLLADEPTGSLDSRNADAVFDVLRGLSRDTGTTVVVVTHDPSFAARADRVVTLRDGALAVAGGVDDAAPSALPSAAMTRDEVLAKIREILVQDFRVSPELVTEDATFRGTLGMDSLDAVDLIYLLKKAFDLGKDAQAFRELHSLRNVVDFVLAERGAGSGGAPGSTP